jgi:hypothetical protein
MGLGKKFKKIVGTTLNQSLQAVGVNEPSFGFLGQTTGLKDARQEAGNIKNALATANIQAQQTAQQNATIAEQSRLRLLAEEDLKRQEEELKKRTTFAGSSMQGVMERKKLLGI